MGEHASKYVERERRDQEEALGSCIHFSASQPSGTGARTFVFALARSCELEAPRRLQLHLGDLLDAALSQCGGFVWNCTWWGVEVEAVPPSLRQQMETPSCLLPGDVITEIAGRSLVG